MTDAGKVRSVLANLDSAVGHLRQLASLPKEEVISDFAKVGALRYYLVVAIACCLDLANHIISALGLREPQDDADALAVLGEAGIIPTDFVPSLQQMARLRNRLVHLYWQVDDALLHDMLKAQLGDFDRYKSSVLAALSPGA